MTPEEKEKMLSRKHNKKKIKMEEENIAEIEVLAKKCAKKSVG